MFIRYVLHAPMGINFIIMYHLTMNITQQLARLLQKFNEQSPTKQIAWKWVHGRELIIVFENLHSIFIFLKTDVKDFLC